MRVLFVDDDEVLAQGVETALRDMGHVCEVAELGKQALMLSKEKTYDIVVLDLGLPDIDGYQVVRLMKVEGVETPVLLQSGLADPDLPAEMDALGVKAFLAKPFSIAELIERMEAVLTGRGSAAPETTPPTPPPRPQPAPRPEADPAPVRPSRGSPGPAGPAAGSKPEAEPAPRPSAVAEARAALRAQPEEPTPLQTVAKCGAGVVSKAVTTARSAMATTMEAGARLLPDAAPGPEAEVGAEASSGFLEKARGALGGAALSKALAKVGAALGTEPEAGPEAAPPLSRLGGKARAALRSNPLSRAVAKVRDAGPDEPATRPEAETETSPVTPRATPETSVPARSRRAPQGRAGARTLARAAAKPPPAPGAGPGVTGDPETTVPAAAPDIPAGNFHAGQVEAGPEAQEAFEAAPAAPEPPPAAPEAEAEPRHAADAPQEPEAEPEAEPAPEDPSSMLSGRASSVADEMATAALDLEPAQDAARPGAPPDVPPDLPAEQPAERDAAPNPEPAGEIAAALPDIEPPKSAPRPAADTPGVIGHPQAELEADPVPEDPSAVQTEPDPEPAPGIEDASPDLEAAAEIEAASLDFGPPQDMTRPEVQAAGPQVDPDAEPNPEPALGPGSASPDPEPLADAPRLESDPDAEPAFDGLSADQPEPAPQPTQGTGESSPEPEPSPDAAWPEAEPHDAPDGPGGPDAGRTAEPAPDDPAEIVAEPGPETPDEVEAELPVSEPLPDAAWPRAETGAAPGGPGHPAVGVEADTAPEAVFGPGSEPAPEAADGIEDAPPEREPPQAAHRHEAEPGVAPDVPEGPEAEPGAEPALDDLWPVLSDPAPQTAEDVEAVSPDPEPPLDAPWPKAQPGVAPDLPGEPDVEAGARPELDDSSTVLSEPEPEAADETRAAPPVSEPPQEAPRPGAAPGEAETACESEAAPDIPSATPLAPGTEPGPEIGDELKHGGDDPSQATSQARPAPEFDTPFGAGPGSAEDGGAARQAASGDDAGPRSDGRPPVVEAAVIVDGNTHHACVILERSERGAALRLYHPERDLPDAFTLRPLKGPERRCVQSWRKDDKIGVEYL